MSKHTIEVVCGDGSTVYGYDRNYDLSMFEAYRYGTAGRVSQARTAATPDAVRLELAEQLAGQKLAQKSAEADGLRREALKLRREAGEEGWRVVILPSGAHYDCASFSEARRVFACAPQTDEETGRQITLNSTIVETEWSAA